jgi:hypothetical protein
MRVNEGRSDQVDVLARQLRFVGGKRGYGHCGGEKRCAEQ